MHYLLSASPAHLAMQPSIHSELSSDFIYPFGPHLSMHAAVYSFTSYKLSWMNIFFTCRKSHAKDGGNTRKESSGYIRRPVSGQSCCCNSLFMTMHW